MSLVLVAEDSPSIRLLLLRRLEMAGHRVIEALSGEEAVTRAESALGEPGPDIVLLDAMLPDACGAEVLRQIKKGRPALPVLIVSGAPDLATSEEWLAADGRLGKPIDFDALLGQIEELTSGRPRP